VKNDLDLTLSPFVNFILTCLCRHVVNFMLIVVILLNVRESILYIEYILLYSIKYVLLLYKKLITDKPGTFSEREKNC